jgi:DivIVA domain-containing protein
VALERDIIEKKDFPIGRRGYDPDAVDAHLATVADEVEALKRRGGQSAQPVATAISEQVRAIVEAAEKSATEIQARAEQEAREIKAEATRTARKERQQATRDAKREREEAAGQAREHVGRVSQSTSKMLERLEAINGDLNALTTSLSEGAERLLGELERVEGELDELSKATASEGEPDEELDEGERPVAAAAEEPKADEAESYAISASTTSVAGGAASAASVDKPVAADEPTKIGDRPPEEPAQSGPVAAPETVAAPAPAAAPEPVAAGGDAASEPDAGGVAAGKDDSEGARLIALNMALNGTPREETDRYLAENFSLKNRKALLDEVYASVGS